MSRLNQQRLAIILAMALITPHQLLADQAADSAETNSPVIRDVELAEGGIARGVVVTSAGHFADGVKVTFLINDDAYETRTNESGRFEVAGLSGGTYVVTVGEKPHETPYGARFWAHGTAPPNALNAFVVVDDPDPIVRGQFGRSLLPGLPQGMGFLNPLAGLSKKQLIALGIGAAVAGATIAIIFAIEDDGDVSN